jgi:hypothetical protein
MKLTDLKNEIQEVLKGLTATQKENWKKLIQYMRKVGNSYDHSDFSDLYYIDHCAMSYAVDGVIIKRVGSGGYGYGTYTGAINEAFGKDSSDVIFASGTDIDEAGSFAMFCFEEAGIEDMGDTTSTAMADALEKLLALTDACQDDIVSIHWKGGKTDRFKNLEALRDFLELNPHRQGTYRKVTTVRKVEVITYKDVVETITP